MSDKRFQAQSYKPGRQIEYTPVAAVNAGDVIIVGTIVAYAPEAIAAGAPGNLEAEGSVWGVGANEAWAQGESLYWNPTGNPYLGTAGTGCFTTTASGGTLAGYARKAKASTDQTGIVQLTSASRIETLAGSLGADDIVGTDSNLGILGKAGAAGGAGGAITSAGGAGDTNGAGGPVSYKGGAGAGTGAGGAATYGGGASGTGATGNGGAVTDRGGAALSTNGNGGAGTWGGGDASGTGTGGASIYTSGASAGASGTVGTLNVDTGARNGGTGAYVEIGASNALGTKIGSGGSERAAIKGVNVSGTVAVAVPSITDPDCAKVDVDISAMTFAAAIGDAVTAIPLEALPTNCRLGGAWVSATDQVTITFSSEGGNVTGANKNFKFLLVDLT